MYGLKNHNYLKILERSDGFVDHPDSFRKGKQTNNSDRENS